MAQLITYLFTPLLLIAQFNAFNIQDDKLVKFDTTKDYYIKVLKATYPSKFISEDALPIVTEDKSSLEFNKKLTDIWKKELKGCLIGYIQADKLTFKKILGDLAKEESKYYYKWQEESEGAYVTVKDEEKEEILNQLKRVSALTYARIFLNVKKSRSTEPPQYDKLISQVFKACGNGIKKAQATNPANFLPIAITDNAYFKDLKGVLYFGVYINDAAKPLYLDTAEETKDYQYTKKSGAYPKQNTYVYDSKQTTFTDDKSAIYDIGTDKRYLVALKSFVNQLAAKGKAEGIRTAVYTLTEKNILDKINKGTTEEQKENKENATAFAEVQAQLLPKGFKCFYYKDDSNALQSFLSSVNIGEGKDSGSGYAMRADKVDEVDYRWGINLSPENVAYPYAQLMAHFMGLDDSKYIEKVPSEKEFFPTNWPTAKGRSKPEKNTPLYSNSWFVYYKQFNPSAKRRNKPAKDPHSTRAINVLMMDEFMKDVTMLEEPKMTRQFTVAKPTFKAKHLPLRMWKKGEAFQSELLGENENDRLNAATVMALALNNFPIYEKIKKQNLKPKVSSSSLPATSFAKYIVGYDKEAQEQWGADNGISSSTKITSDFVRTDQEWCHLLGHGDGGTEELGNFASGSKHCNTEQLAIETGQRRITHNNKKNKSERLIFGPEIKNKIRARITAYLMPNEGTWMSGSYTLETIKKALKSGIKENTNKVLQAVILGDIIEKKDVDKDSDLEAIVKVNDAYKSILIYTIDSFFEFTGGSSYKLKSPEQLQAAFVGLKEKIQKVKNYMKKTPNDATTAMKKAARTLTANLEANYFIYLPLARWVRYKIYYDNQKVFDHIFDAQSECLDFNECQILDYTVERVLYMATGKIEEHKAVIKERVKDLISTEEEYNFIEKVLRNIEEVDGYIQKLRKCFQELQSSYNKLIKEPLELDKLIPGVTDTKRRLEETDKDIHNNYKRYLSNQEAFVKEISELSSKTSLSTKMLNSLEKQLALLKKANNIYHNSSINLEKVLAKLTKSPGGDGKGKRKKEESEKDDTTAKKSKPEEIDSEMTEALNFKDTI